MDVIEAISKRRAYRSLDQINISVEIINDLAGCVRLSASCFNNQPWRYIFVYDPEILKKMHSALSQGNVWAQDASMIIAVFSKPEFDCVIEDRKYYLFDTGMATAALILRTTELGLVAHPIAGFDPKKTKEVLGIPDEMEVITLVIVGRHSETISRILSDKQVEAEKNRPERLALEKFVYINSFT